MTPDDYLHVVREDPKRSAACSTRAPSAASLFSRDDGATWEPLKVNLPTVAVTTSR